eukprot:6458631-Prymnesium_polylepis.2
MVFRVLMRRVRQPILADVPCFGPVSRGDGHGALVVFTILPCVAFGVKRRWQRRRKGGPR